MKCKKCLYVLIILLLTLSYSTSYAYNEKKVNSKSSGKKWRIGYCESESFVNYSSMLHSLLEGLNELKWIDSIKEMEYTAGQEDTDNMWNWMSQKDISSKIEFVSNAYYSLSSMDENAKDEMLRRLEKDDLDLIIVMGTSAGKLLSSNNSNTPIMVFNASNAVASGIIKSEEDSGKDNIWAHMDSKRFQRQITVFHDMFKFNKLGIVCEDSQTAKNYSAVDDVELIASKEGFEVIYSYVNEPASEDDKERYNAQVYQAYKSLSQQVDAMYVTVASLDSKKLSSLLIPFYEEKIPVFSQLGGSEVANGALLSITVTDFKNTGRFGADNIVRLFNGEALRSLPQVFESTPQIIINLDVADKIGYKVPFEILLSADEIYTKIGDNDGARN